MIRPDIQNDSDAALDRRIDRSLRDCPRLRSDCDWAQLIRPSRQDVLTRQTKEQIVAHNEIGSRLGVPEAKDVYKDISIEDLKDEALMTELRKLMERAGVAKETLGKLFQSGDAAAAQGSLL